jgi:hypothetical protein
MQQLFLFILSLIFTGNTFAANGDSSILEERAGLNLKIECRARLQDGNEYSAQILGKIKALPTSRRDSFDASGVLRVQLLQNNLVVFDRRLEVAGGYSTQGRERLLNVSAEVDAFEMHISAELKSADQVMSEIQFKDKVFPMNCAK